MKKYDDIPMDFEPRCRNRYLSIHQLFFVIRKGFIRYRQLSRTIQRHVDFYLKARMESYSTDTQEKLK